MLPCGEDLGMVPDCVPWVMEQLQLLTLEIERMPKTYGREFADVEAYPRWSVCSTGTHDMSTLRGWWQEDPTRSARYFFEVLGHGGDAPTDAQAWLCEEIVRRHVDCPSMLCILPWQDWLAIDERLRLPDVDANASTNRPTRVTIGVIACTSVSKRSCSNLISTRDSVNFCSMDDGLKCDAFGRFEFFSLFDSSLLSSNATHGYTNRSPSLLNFEISLFADIPMLSGGVSGFCNKSKIIYAEP